MPEAVVAPGPGADSVYGIVDTKLIPFLVEAIKEQQVEIQQQKAEIGALRAEVAALKPGVQ